MTGFSYERRIALSSRIPEEGQFAVIADIPQFADAAIHNFVPAPAEQPQALRMLVFNIERGVHLQETIDFLQQCPALGTVDVIFANELDDGAVRSGQKDVAAEIAKAVGMNYVYGLEFIELVNPDDQKGFHGNALFSRWPITWAKVVQLPEQYNWYFDRQKRIGARCAVFCKLQIGAQEVGVVSVHLENRADGPGRAAQMQTVLDEVQAHFAGLPVVIGGDFNTNTFDGNDIAAFTELFEHPEELKRHMDEVDRYEEMLPLMEQHGFFYRSISSGEGTRRKPMPNGGALLLKLDWLFVRGMEGKAFGTISTLRKDCGWAKQGSALAAFDGDEISDHNAIWADCAFPVQKED